MPERVGADQSRRSVLVLVALFGMVFAAGFVPGAPNLFLFPLGALAYAGAAILVRTRSDRTADLPRTRLIVTATAALTFSAGVLYGVAGMWGFYEIVDAVYLTVVGGSALVFLLVSATLLSSRWRAS